MKITICGSMAFIDEMEEVKHRLMELGHEVQIPTPAAEDETGKEISAKIIYQRKKLLNEDDPFIWDAVNIAMRDHFKKVVWSEAILVCNFDKNGIDNYIGPNTLIEMGLALHLNKRICLLKPIPKVDWKEELLGMKPIILNDELARIA
jgi:hypothetical protein